jgi:hypothetical protein
MKKRELTYSHSSKPRTGVRTKRSIAIRHVQLTLVTFSLFSMQSPMLSSQIIYGAVDCTSEPLVSYPLHLKLQRLYFPLTITVYSNNWCNTTSLRVLLFGCCNVQQSKVPQPESIAQGSFLVSECVLVAGELENVWYILFLAILAV